MPLRGRVLGLCEGVSSCLWEGVSSCLCEGLSCICPITANGLSPAALRMCASSSIILPENLKGSQSIPTWGEGTSLSLKASMPTWIRGISRCSMPIYKRFYS